MDEPPDIDFACPPRMRRWLDYFRRWAISAQPLSGLGNDVRQAGGKGRSIDAALAIGGKKGSSTPSRPFQLVNASDEDTHNIRVIYSTLAGAMPDGFSEGDDPPYILEDVGDAAGKVYAEVTLDMDTGEVLSRDLAFGATVPASDPTIGYFTGEIGSFNTVSETFGVSNSGYGPAYLAREWFTYPANYQIVLS
jgi:hypothetical protein